MKMEITVKIKNNDGVESIKPIIIDTEIPEFEEFKGPDNFREIFDKYLEINNCHLCLTN